MIIEYIHKINYIFVIFIFFIQLISAQYYDNPYRPMYGYERPEYDNGYGSNGGMNSFRGFDGYGRSHQNPEFFGEGPNFYGPQFGGLYGQPAPGSHTHDNFDREKTSDEVISARINPLPHFFNRVGIRRGLTTLQQIEARYNQKPHPQREVLRPLLLLTNPSKR